MFLGNRTKYSGLKFERVFVGECYGRRAGADGPDNRAKCMARNAWAGAKLRRKSCADGAAGAGEAVIDRAALVGCERRQGGQRIGFGGRELGAAERAKGVPAFREKEFGFGAAVAAGGDVGGQGDGFGARGLAEELVRSLPGSKMLVLSNPFTQRADIAKAIADMEQALGAE